jgi:hypothetical protein
MEKDNKKAREAARKEYNETVRVSYVTTIDRQSRLVTELDRPS